MYGGNYEKAYHPWKSLLSMDGRPLSMDGRFHEWDATYMHKGLAIRATGDEDFIDKHYYKRDGDEDAIERDYIKRDTTRMP